jgi:hypothetical protein
MHGLGVFVGWDEAKMRKEGAGSSVTNRGEQRKKEKEEKKGWGGVGCVRLRERGKKKKRKERMREIMGHVSNCEWLGGDNVIFT